MRQVQETETGTVTILTVGAGLRNYILKGERPDTPHRLRRFGSETRI
jgi:hypothetical protein